MDHHLSRLAWTRAPTAHALGVRTRVLCTTAAFGSSGHTGRESPHLFGMSALALVAAAASLLLSPPLARLDAACTRRAVVWCSAADDADALPLIGGLPIEEGEGVLCRDEESDAWWRATVKQIRGSEVLVHFTGCDDAWDQWLDSSSPDLMRMDRVEQKKDEVAFQSDSLEESMDDAELLEEYRKQRWDENAKWQLTTFAQAQLGSWAGEIDLYELDGSGGVRKRVGPWKPECSCETATVADMELELVDTLPSVAAQLAVSTRMGAPAFRPEVGNMAVAGAFSLATPADGGWLFEVAIREEERRVRCKLLYTADGDAAPADGDAVPPMSLASMAILREGRGGTAFYPSDSEEAADIDGSPGRGLYDPPPGDKLDYCSLYIEGGVTLVFPTRVTAGGSGAISLDWIAGTMRYQLDRKFKKLDGSLSSLELTEIQKEDAEKYLPDFPHQGGGETA